MDAIEALLADADTGSTFDDLLAEIRATLAANLLREHGAPQVLLLGLHLLA